MAVIPKTTAIDYWDNLHAGARDAAKPLGLRIFWNAPQSEAEFAEQALMVEDLIRQKKMDGIVLAPSHGSVLASAVQHARHEGIPLVVVDSPVMVNDEDYVAYIGSDQEQIGTLAAMRAGSDLGGVGYAGVIGVSPTIQSTVMRERAFASAIHKNFPGINLVVRYGLSDTVRSREIANEMLKADPQVGVIFASDQFATRGALIALRNLGEAHNVKLIGVAQERDLVSYLDRSEIDALVVQDPYSMGYRGVEIIGKALSGWYDGPKRIQTGTEIATREVLQSGRIQQLIRHRS